MELRERTDHLAALFKTAFGGGPAAYFSAPGRTELGGNHTDHQHGHVLAAAVDLDILAAVRPNGGDRVRIASDGYVPFSVDLADLSPRGAEKNTSAALVRGVAAGFRDRGFDLSGAGFDACLGSEIPAGSGLSSSAAFELLIGTIFNSLFCADRLDPLSLARIGQAAENVYFGKPCGLMDQTAAALGGVVAIDFADPESPRAERIDLDLDAFGYALCIIDSGAGHADLTGEYAAITDELAAVARHFGRGVLREVPEADFLSALPALRKEAGDRAVLRAMHYYAEDARAVLEADALRAGDLPRFLALVRASGRSSALYLQNAVPTGETRRQELLFTVALCERLLAGDGAVRLHGGGFGGTAQAFVPLERLDAFRRRTEAVLGDGSCRAVRIRPEGGVRLS